MGGLVGGRPGGWAGVGLSLSVGVEQERKEKGKDKKRRMTIRRRILKNCIETGFFLFRGKCTILKVGVLGVF